MADKKITALTATTAGLVADLAHIVTDVATNPTNKKITLLNFFNKVPTFIGFAGTGIQAYTSATFVHDVAGGGASIITPGTLSGGASVSLTDVGDSVSMVFTTTRGWVITGMASGVAPVSTSLILTMA
mgnify:CR=1 FL=1